MHVVRMHDLNPVAVNAVPLDALNRAPVDMRWEMIAISGVASDSEEAVLQVHDDVLNRTFQ